jgi:hypothetical protein
VLGAQWDEQLLHASSLAELSEILGDEDDLQRGDADAPQMAGHALALGRAPEP